MLILTRKSGEGIKIGEDVRVVILETKGNQVRIGIEAPKGMKVYRDEVYEKIKQENINASVITTDHMQKLFKIWTDKGMKS
ncbi:MAG: carbon storage regulator [Thermodesulfovibrio sp. RBG_19FT_COMBO_42_12]|nr:MAG: carbon storage regulator [Thermodesulfovibrio sp. RBG_19FT_COMBO_42_12]HZX48151.1 carbon storage regulator CsrA [Nitrospirota bacterium]